jgi:hypothetical protein
MSSADGVSFGICDIIPSIEGMPYNSWEFVVSTYPAGTSNKAGSSGSRDRATTSLVDVKLTCPFGPYIVVVSISA